MLKSLNPADASTLLSKLVNVLYLLAFLVTLAVAIFRGDALPVLQPCPEAQAVQAAPDAPPSVPPAVLEPTPQASDAFPSESVTE